MKPEDRAILVPYLKEDAIKFLCECFHNVLYSNLQLRNKKGLKNRLKKNCSVHNLKVIARQTGSIKNKVKALKQEGAGIGFILSAAIPFLMNLLTGK